jgi:dipeptidyl aminopeptidase/acylaminoacyl peptidase
VTFPRAKAEHAVSLSNCDDRVIGKPRHRVHVPMRSSTGELAAVKSRRGPSRKVGTETITIDGHAVYTVEEDYRSVPAGTPGPIGLVGWSPDAHWLLFFVDPLGSASIVADGIHLKALRVPDGRSVPVATVLHDRDYLGWCGSALVLAAGGDRLATHDKRLVVARAPDWKPRTLWRAPGRAVGSVACAPDGRSVAVLSQPAGGAADSGQQSRWQLWRVGLNGSRRLLDSPPKGWADESPRWSRDGRSILFVREQKNRGTLMLWRAGRITGPIADIGFDLGYYGHHDWWQQLTWSAGA